MEVGNDIVIQNGTQWSFGNGVAQHFDEHVSQSIPLYDEGHNLVCHLSDFFIRDHSLCYELGSATGNLIGKLYQRHKSKKEVRFIGIEEISEMNQVQTLTEFFVAVLHGLDQLKLTSKMVKQQLANGFAQLDLKTLMN